MKVVLEYIQRAFGSKDELSDLLTAEKKIMRDELWTGDLDQRFKQGSLREVSKKRAYMLRRLHNRISRLVPNMIRFCINTGGMSVYFNMRCIRVFCLICF